MVGRARLPDALGGRPAEGRAPVRAARGAHRPLARLRRGRRRARPVGPRDRRDHHRAGARGPRRHRVRALGLHDQHAHGDGARARDRLRAVRGVALPGGAVGRTREARRDRRDRRHGESRGALQRFRLRHRDARAPAHPEHDLPEPRRGRDPGGHHIGRRRADASPRGAEPARRPGQRPPDSVHRPGRRAWDGRREPLLGRGRAGSDAAAGREPRAERRVAGRPGDSRPQLHDGRGRNPHAAGPLCVEAGVQRAGGSVRDRHHRLGRGRRRRRRCEPGNPRGDRADRRRHARERRLPAGRDRVPRRGAACGDRGATGGRQPRRQGARFRPRAA